MLNLRKAVVIFIALILVLPSSALASENTVVTLDYGKIENWAYFENDKNKDVDVFLICPTVDTKSETNSFDLNDKLKSKFINALDMEKGIYEDTGRLFSPYYRQMSMNAYKLTEEERANAQEIAYSDISAAFRWYLDNENNGHGIILAGFSQGSQMCLELLKEYFGGEGEEAKKLSKNLIAVYAIGWAVTEEMTKAYPQIVPAGGETDTGVVVSFDCEDGTLTETLVIPAGTKALSINPLNWKTDSTVADKSLNLGAVMGTGETPIPELCGAYIGSRGELVVTGISKEQYPAVIDIFPDGSYHIYDYMFFFENLKNNVEARAGVWRINSHTETASLPLVVIRVDESEEAIANANQNDSKHQYGTIEDVNNSENHSVRGIGTFEIILPDGYKSEFGSENIPTGEVQLDYIRGRGNSTWGNLKKPYKLKFSEKQEILGMGKNKEWGLLANYMDKTLTNNAVAMWISRQMGMEYTMKMLPVEVIMSGGKSGTKYLGSYYLTELVDIGKSRVNIPELDKDMTNETDNITGGYLISLYYDPQDWDKPRSTVFRAEKSGLEFINENPEFESEDLTEGQKQQRKYIRDYINELDGLIMTGDVIDETTHNKIADLLDLKSTADYWLIQEFLINYDAYRTSSNYLYKKPDGKLYWGPFWDFDLMYLNTDKENPEDAVSFNNYRENAWLDNLRDKDEQFAKLLKERWQVLEPILIELTNLGGTLDQYKERQQKAWEVNYDIWMRDVYSEGIDYDKEFENLRNVIDFRRNWFNENIDKIGDTYYTVSYEVDGEIVNTETVRGLSYAIADLTPAKEGYYFGGWINKENGKSVGQESITADTVFAAEFVNPNEIKEEINLYLSKYEDWAKLDNGEYYGLSADIYNTKYADVLKENLAWTSSDENIATVQNGTVSLHSAGDVTITATLFNGTSKSFLLHIYGEGQETIEEPDDFILEKDKFTLEVGKTAQIIYSFVPNKPIDENNYIYVDRSISDEEVIDIDYSECPVLTALKEGTATITLDLYGAHNNIITSKTVEVTVKSNNKHSGKRRSSNNGAIITNKENIIGEDTIAKSVKSFADVKSSDWFYEDIRFAVENGLFVGTPETEFSPNQNLTRGMLVTVLYRLAGATDTQTSEFDDVDSKEYYSAPVAWASKSGFVNGVGDNKFSPESEITREDLATIIYRYVKAHGKSFIDNPLFQLEYNDKDEIADYAYDPICYLTMNGVLVGKGDNRVDPKGLATRAETAKILKKVSELLK